MKYLSSVFGSPNALSHILLLCLVTMMALMAGFAVAAHAQTIKTSSATVTASYRIATHPAANQLAVVDEPVALGEALIRELRLGGYVLFVRHGAVQPSSIDKRSASVSVSSVSTSNAGAGTNTSASGNTGNTGEWWKNCATTQTLAPSALPQAQAIGIALRNQRIAVDEVLSSEFCRAYDTALFIGAVAPKRTAALNAATAFESASGGPTKTPAQQSADLQQLLLTPVAAGKNRILVGHTVPATAVHPVLSILTETQTAIFKPVTNNGVSGGFQFVTILTPGQWQWLGKQAVSDSPNLAATASTPPAAQPPQVTQPPPVQLPVIDPARELKGLALVQALRKGGFNLYMRHASSTIGTDQDLLKVPLWWENCAIQRNISDTGRDQARKVGRALAALQIPVGDIKTSQFCRARDTGHLMNLGALEVTEELNHAIGQRNGTSVDTMRFALLATAPPKGTNVLMISHTHGTQRPEERVMGQMAEAEIVVFWPDGKGGSEPLARIPPAEWDNLLMLMNPAVINPAAAINPTRK